MIKNLPKLIVIVGPTATGKTALSIELAKQFHGSVISADSRQIYKGMDIGSGKITRKEMQGITHYLLDIANPKRKFSVGQYKILAEKAIKKIIKQKRIPFLVGGTGFYIQAIADNLILPKIKPDWQLRANLEKLTTQQLFNKLRKLDQKRAKNIDSNNRRRLIRALEIIKKTKKTIPPLLNKKPNFDSIFIGIKKSKEEISSAIKKRLDKRLKNDMIAEVKKLKDQGISWKRLEEFGLEYRFIAQYLQNKINYEQMKERIQKESEQYGKRQMTWFKKDQRINWIKNQKEAQKIIKQFLR
jgi:tRNA dimethylallyltransferase